MDRYKNSKRMEKERHHVLRPHIKREIIALMLLLAAAYTFACLLSFNPDDPTLNSIHQPVKEVRVLNWCGTLGAILADILLQYLGAVSYLIPIFFLFFTFNLFFIKSLLNNIVKLLGILILIASGSLLMELILPSPFWLPSYLHGGGTFGFISADFLTGYLNPIGTYLFGVMLFFIGLMLAFNFSFVSLGNYIMKILTAMADSFMELYHTIKGNVLRRREARARSRRVVKEREKKIKKPLPKVELPEPSQPVKVHKTRQEEVQHKLPLFDEEESKEYTLPSPELLDIPVSVEQSIDHESLIAMSQMLEKKLLDFGVEGEVVRVQPGPVVTMYEFQPAAGIKISKVSSLNDDLAMNLRALSVRIVAPIPGKNVVGVEIPNNVRQNVYLKEILTQDAFISSKSLLTVALGKDITGGTVVLNLTKMPHLLVAGATGSGKSVSLNSMIVSILYKARPDQVKFIMVDPKRLELSSYNGIPHLLLPIMTNIKNASMALKWAVGEMERRYQLLAEFGVRSIDKFNKKVEKHLNHPDKQKTVPADALLVSEEEKDESLNERMPYIVIVIDELADIMMLSSREVEESIARLAQMARAAGIHLIVATQRPTVDVITGIIKANFPARISFQVTSRTDSRVILDTIGAEQLLGSGDMLLLPPDSSKLRRVHGAYVSGEEIEKLVESLKKQGQPEYDHNIITPRDEEHQEEEEEDFEDPMYDRAVDLVQSTNRYSISYIQRRLRVGYNRAARMVEKMEAEGIIEPRDNVNPPPS